MEFVDIVKIALGIFLKYFIDQFPKIKEWTLNLIDKSRQISNPKLMQVKISHFVDNEEELKKVITIRRNFFGSSTITSDIVYNNLVLRNKFAFKIVSVEDETIGYWSIIPINEETYKKFITSKTSHSEILQNSISWQDSGEKIFLYIVGIVVNSKEGEITSKMKSATLLYDMFDFAIFTIDKLLKKNKSVTICGYPSTNEGLQIFKSTYGFYWNGEIQSNKNNQKIFICEGDNIGKLLATMKLRMETDKEKKYRPNWIDKKNFVEIIT